MIFPVFVRIAHLHPIAQDGCPSWAVKPIAPWTSSALAVALLHRDTDEKCVAPAPWPGKSRDKLRTDIAWYLSAGGNENLAKPRSGDWLPMGHMLPSQGDR